MQKIWFVKHPTSQYVEDVKGLARQNNLRIYDAKFSNDFNPEYVATDAPKLTPKPKKAKRGRPPAAQPAPDAQPS